MESFPHTARSVQSIPLFLPVPRGNIGKSLEIFHYLGGGDFTGRVFCSTLEGEFVKAFGYTDGRLSGRLLVMKRTELARHAGEGQYDHYSTIRLAEGM